MKESEIRPKEILDKYLELSYIDGEKLDENEFDLVNCPGCGLDSSIQDPNPIFNDSILFSAKLNELKMSGKTK